MRLFYYKLYIIYAICLLNSEPVSSEICELRDGNCYNELTTTYITSPLFYNYQLIYWTYQIQREITEYISRQSFITLHVSYNYLCNYTQSEMLSINTILRQHFKMKPFIVGVKGLTCNLDMRTLDRRYIHFTFDNTTLLEYYSNKIEDLLLKHGMHIQNPHKISGPIFHITIATVPLNYNIIPLLAKYSDMYFTDIYINSITLSNPFYIWI